MLSDPGESNRHHRGGEQRAIVDGSLGQNGVETAGPFHGDHLVANHRLHSAGQDMVNASDFIAEVAHLEAAFTFCLHLMWAPFGEALY